MSSQGSSPGREHLLCSWARHGASLHPAVQMGTGDHNAGGNPAMDYHVIQGEAEILLVASWYRNWYKLQPLDHLDFMQLEVVKSTV